MRIGRVFLDSYEVDGKKIPFIMMDIRTISIKKKFTIAVNTQKWESNKVGQGAIPQGKENYPDYNIWCSNALRGEVKWDEIVGSISDETSQGGLKYKKGKIFDPFIQKENIYFALFSVEDNKKVTKDHLYDVVVEPYRKMNNDETSS